MWLLDALNVSKIKAENKALKEKLQEIGCNEYEETKAKIKQLELNAEKNLQDSQNQLNIYHSSIEKYITNRVDDQIKWYDNKSCHCQKLYKLYQTVEIIIAAAIPLLSGYTNNHLCIPLIIGILGSVIAIIESITKLFKWHENWIEYRTTCELLRYQKNLFLTKSAPYNTGPETVENIFVRNIENIISSENNKWKNINSLEENNTKDAL